MAHRQLTLMKNIASPVARTATSAVVLMLILGLFSPSFARAAEKGRNVVEKEIWKLEEAYFTNLYGANYDKVLALVHPQFLGWPGRSARKRARSS